MFTLRTYIPVPYSRATPRPVKYNGNISQLTPTLLKSLVTHLDDTFIIPNVTLDDLLAWEDRYPELEENRLCRYRHGMV